MLRSCAKRLLTKLETIADRVPQGTDGVQLWKQEANNESRLAPDLFDE